MQLAISPIVGRTQVGRLGHADVVLCSCRAGTGVGLGSAQSVRFGFGSLAGFDLGFGQGFGFLDRCCLDDLTGHHSAVVFLIG